MNIAIFTHSYLPSIGGLEQVVRNLSQQLIKRHHRVIIVVFVKNKKTKNFEIIEGVPVYRFLVPFPLLPRKGVKGIIDIFNFLCTLLLIVPQLVILLKNEKVQIINVQYTGINALIAWLLSWIYPIKFVITLQGFSVHVLPSLKGFRMKMVRFIFKAVLHRAAFVTACSEYMANTLVQIMPGIKNKITIVENGVEIEEFKLNGKALITSPYILCLGRLHNPFKGFDLALFAFKEILESGFDINLAIVGDGPNKSWYRGLARLLRIEEKLIFFGPASRAQTVNLFRNCEFFLMPSRIEPFGIVNLEAMACGKAVAASRTGGIPEIVQDQITGLLFEPCNIKEMANVMRQLLENKSLRDKLGANGRVLVENGKFSWSNIALCYLRIYEKVLSCH